MVIFILEFENSLVIDFQGVLNMEITVLYLKKIQYSYLNSNVIVCIAVYCHVIDKMMKAVIS